MERIWKFVNGPYAGLAWYLAGLLVSIFGTTMALRADDVNQWIVLVQGISLGGNGMGIWFETRDLMQKRRQIYFSNIAEEVARELQEKFELDQEEEDGK